MKKILFAFFLLAYSIGIIHSQVAINDDNSDANASTILDVNSSSKGVLLPRVDIVDLSTEAPLTAPVTNGMFVYNTNTSTGVGICYWRNNEWVRLATSEDVHVGASKMVFEAEYPGAITMAIGSSNNGILISDNVGSSEEWMNYYLWWSSEFTVQQYAVVLRLTLPDDFHSWQSNAIVVDYQTTNASELQNYLSAEVYLESSGTALATIDATASTSWTTATILSTSLSSLSAGETIAIVLELGSSNDQSARVGDVTLNYNK